MSLPRQERSPAGLSGGRFACSRPGRFTRSADTLHFAPLALYRKGPTMAASDELYLGDGLYASFDGWSIKLRAPREGGDHVVYLEPDLYQALTAYAARCWRRDGETDGESPSNSPTER
jgi:hypothetical protein